MKTTFAIIDAAPLSIVVMCCAGLIVYLTDRKLRLTILACLALLPLTPILALRFAAVGVIWLCDRSVQGRWAEPFARRAQWLADNYRL